MAQFEYCPPFSVFNGIVPGVRPVLETHSLLKALENLNTRPNCSVSVSVLVTEGDISTLIPITLSSMDLAGKDGREARAFIESSAEARFRSMTANALIPTAA